LTSSLHRLVDQLDFNDIMCEQAYELFNNYAKSKLANLLFTKELQRRSLNYCLSSMTTHMLPSIYHHSCRFIIPRSSQVTRAR